MPREDEASEREARSIAALMGTQPGMTVSVIYDRVAGAWAVRAALANGLGRRRTRFDLMISAQGAVYAVFRDGRWLGGMGTEMRAGQTLPRDAAAAFETLIVRTLAP